MRHGALRGELEQRAQAFPIQTIPWHHFVPTGHRFQGMVWNRLKL
jgi:hypothetical protein